MRFLVMVALCGALVVGGAPLVSAGPVAVVPPATSPPFGTDGWSVTVESGPDGALARRAVPAGASTGRPVLALGDPARLLEGPKASAPTQLGRPGSPGLAALQIRIGGSDSTAGTASDEEVEGEEGEVEEGAVEEGAEPTATYRDVEAIGDVTGDGIDEVAVYTSTWPAGAGTLEVRRGGDLALLWGRPIGYAGLATAGDVDGDDRADLVLTELTATRTVDEFDCAEDFSTCSGRYEAMLDWRASVLDGTTGTVHWSQTHAGREVYAYSYDEDSYTVEEAVDYLLPDAAGDHDGDGLADVLLSAVSLEYAYSEGTTDESEGLGLIGTSWAEEHLTATTDARVVSGDDASMILQLTHDQPNELGLPSVAWGDLTDDGTEDIGWEVLVLTPAERSCTTLVLLGAIDCDVDDPGSITLRLAPRDGRTGEVLWSTDMANPFITFPFTDLDGDGATELWVLAGAETADTALVSGRDGSVRWAVSDEDWLLPIAVDDMDGDADLDLLTGMFIFDLDTFSSSIELRRMDALTADVWLTTSPLTHEWELGCGTLYSYLAAAADGDGDDIDDVVVGQVGEDYGSDCEQDPPSAHSQVVAESAARGSLLHEERTDTLLTLLPTGDLDADGRVDLLRRDDTAGSSEAISGLLGSSLWTLTSRDESVGGVYADIDGVPGDDIAARAHVTTSSGDHDEVLRLINGLDLTERLRSGPR